MTKLENMRVRTYIDYAGELHITMEGHEHVFFIVLDREHVAKIEEQLAEHEHKKEQLAEHEHKKEQNEQIQEVGTDTSDDQPTV